MLKPSEFRETIQKHIEEHNDEQLNIVCDQLIASLYSNQNSFPELEAEWILFLLRSSLYFSLMQKIGDAFIQTGRASFTIYRQYAQSLIEQGNYHLAIFLLSDLVEKTNKTDNEKAKKEYAEAVGLMGRVYKQLFVNATRPINAFTLEYFKKAVPFYKSGYDKNKSSVWHGINTASLLYLAKKEKIENEMPPPEEIAEELLKTITQKKTTGTADAWDYASAAEANIILGRWEDAFNNLKLYLQDSKVNSFAIKGTLRQFNEVLQLNTEPKGAAILLALEKALHTSNTPALKFNSSQDPGYQKRFSEEKYKTLEWYEDGLTRSKAVARIGVQKSKGDGTGFLLRGSLLSEKLNDDFVLVTNAHVISNEEEVINDPKIKAFRAEDVCVIFEKVNPQEVFQLDSVYWTSRPEGLDTSIVRFSTKDIPRINEIGSQADPFPISKSLPILDEQQKVYIIGHPNGETLSFSLDDNKLLDYEKPRIHYRTPTDPGSSGSPLFNRNWKLIGLHHKGSETLQKLNSQSGTYEANEGIWIWSVISQLRADGK
jgi:V8-like Glu-specific endopeptidase